MQLITYSTIFINFGLMLGILPPSSTFSIHSFFFPFSFRTLHPRFLTQFSYFLMNKTLSWFTSFTSFWRPYRNIKLIVILLRVETSLFVFMFIKALKPGFKFHTPYSLANIKDSRQIITMQKGFYIDSFIPWNFVRKNFPRPKNILK